MANIRGKSAGSFLLLDEYFAAESDAFLDELCALTDARKLATFVERWKADPRPWAKRMMFDYLGRPLAVSGHNVVVKRLFKHAEKQNDSQLMAVFLHVFDCLVRRQRRMKWHWDGISRQAGQIETLVAPKDNIRPEKLHKGRNPRTGELIWIPSYVPSKGKLFSYRTRYYLRRRVWRYFRRLGYSKPTEYPAVISSALARYTDADLAKGESILDSWCLLNVCYRGHDALKFTPSHVKVNEGRSLNELSPAPKHAKSWAAPTAAEALWALLGRAESRLVRIWAKQLLQQHHAAFLATLSAEKLKPLFESFDPETQQFAAQLLENMKGLGSLPIASWLQLLETKDPGALSTICNLMVRHVASDRLNLAQLLALACAAPAPVANLGLLFLRTRTFKTASEFAALSELSRAQCDAVAGSLATFALSVIGSLPQYDVALVSRFFDALRLSTRAAAWAWLTPDSAGYNDPALWARLVETPYEDMRLRLVQVLEERAALPGATIDQLAPVWSSVLLGIHRGGRHKIKALHQISRTLVAHPEEAERLLPIAAVAIRSVRPAEGRVGLAAVVQAVESNPGLGDAAARAIPELRFVSAGATA